MGTGEDSINLSVDDHGTESQKEWANWAAHGYGKLYQPRSVRRFGLVFTVVCVSLLLTVFWFVAHGGLPW
jgi:hypothetical protein